MVALPPHDACHETPDSERLLRSFGNWQSEWDDRPQVEVDTTFRDQVDFAIKCILYGAGPIRLRFALAQEYGERCQVKRVATAAYRAIQDAGELPAEVQRAVIAAQRQEAIQGALVDRAWGPALAGLARAGDVAGELAEDTGLRPEDLRLVVEVEDDAAPLPEGQGEPVEAIQRDQEPIQADPEEL